MRCRAFTGVRNPPEGSKNKVRLLLMTLDPEESELVIGCCVGIDQMVGEEGKKFGFKIYGVVPADRLRVDPLFANYCTSFEFMPDGTDYMDRNSRLIEISYDLHAFPMTAEEEVRSGTWSTVRRARRKGMIVTIIPLKGV